MNGQHPTKFSASNDQRRVGQAVDMQEINVGVNRKKKQYLVYLVGIPSTQSDVTDRLSTHYSANRSRTLCASKISVVCLWFSAESQVAAVDINY